MDKLELILFNVGHGLASTFVEHPEKYVTHIDLGGESDFSPLTHLATTRKLRPDILYVTHPHADHLSDIDNAFVSSCRPDYLYYQNYDWDDVANRERPQLKDRVRKFQKLIATVPEGAYAGSGTLRTWCWTPQKAMSIFGESTYVNNSSLFLIYKWQDFKISVGGDLETDAMERLIRQEVFQQQAAGTDILVAPHHGHLNGYTSLWPSKIGKPHVVLVSVQNRDPGVAPGYASPEFARGITVGGRTRYMLTTRSDGTITVTMYYGTDGKPKWHFSTE